jgi:hypothetical protein
MTTLPTSSIQASEAAFQTGSVKDEPLQRRERYPLDCDFSHSQKCMQLRHFIYGNHVHRVLTSKSQDVRKREKGIRGRHLCHPDR